MPEPPRQFGPRPRGVTASDVERAADQLLRDGQRPTIEKVRERLGTGSPNTINPLLDAWWKKLAPRLDAGPAAFHRLPESVAHVAEALWMQALDEGRKRAALEAASTTRANTLDKQSLEVRSHVLTLREGELDSRLRDRERSMAALETQLQELTTLLRKEQATRDAQTRRIAELEQQLLARRQPPVRTTKVRTPPPPRGKPKPSRAAKLRRPTTTNVGKKAQRKKPPRRGKRR